jgi:hypothetical protein
LIGEIKMRSNFIVEETDEILAKHYPWALKAQPMNIRITLQPNGEHTAIDDDTYDGEGSPMGWGATPEAAIEDLKEQLVEREANI